MDAASHFTALAHQDLPFYVYSGEVCQIAAVTVWNDATLNKLFWLGANYYRPVDHPDPTGLSLEASGPEPETACRRQHLP